MFVVALILFVLAAVAVVTGVLGWTGKLPRNRFFGVHTEEALRTDEVFRIANRVAAPTSAAAGLLLACAAAVVAVAPVIPALSVTAGALLIALFTIGAGAGVAAKSIAGLAPAPEIGGCGSACASCTLRSACDTAN
ncbi:SdpI family protein [Nocardia stercoris]|uniref:SdpI family protein n=1 Tax=Nocardia stercoris TaxID=2483361 RepID=A0A3M2LDE2_9NOCA|nr:SdpI family protein [Nocardia stercoris]RMI33985.1 SdpI family protein [Nocardia stercoris]